MIDFDEMAAGLNKRRMIQSAVFKELVKVLEHLLAFYADLCATNRQLFHFVTRLCVQISTILLSIVKIV